MVARNIAKTASELTMRSIKFVQAERDRYTNAIYECTAPNPAREDQARGGTIQSSSRSESQSTNRIMTWVYAAKQALDPHTPTPRHPPQHELTNDPPSSSRQGTTVSPGLRVGCAGERDRASGRGRGGQRASFACSRSIRFRLLMRRVRA